jgi:hypothetical protein
MVTYLTPESRRRPSARVTKAEIQHACVPKMLPSATFGTLDHRSGTCDGRAVKQHADQRVVWLLDVDGVLAVERPDPHVHARHRLRAGGWPVDVWIAPEAVARIRIIVERYDLRLAWLTTWGREAADVLAPQIRLPTAEVLAPPDDGSRTAAQPGDPLGLPWWKEEAARRFLATEAPRALVWTDDDITDAVRTEASARWGISHLLLAPNPGVGLTDAELDRIESAVQAWH